MPVYIIASTIFVARAYCRKHGGHWNHWRFIWHREVLFALPDKTEVLYLWADKHGSFNFGNTEREIVRVAKQLEKEGRIGLKFVRMEDPP